MTLGSGCIEGASSKQKLVAKSAHESEILSLSDKITRGLWMRNLLIAQGEKMGPITVYQDNMGVLEVCKRGQNATSRTKLIAIRYNFIRNYLDRGEIKLVCEPTLKMIADIMTKPLQGKLFSKLREALLGYEFLEEDNIN